MLDTSLVFSDKFVISCGTVALDLKRSLVLLIRWRKNNQILLPKGRKNIDESLEDAALRETYEETGHNVRLLPLIIHTNAPRKPVWDLGHASTVGENPCSEPIAMQQRITPKGRLKIIYWYAAFCDASISPVPDTQMANEDYETIWASFSSYQKVMTFDNDKMIVARVIELATAQVAEWRLGEEEPPKWVKVLRD